MFLGQTLIKVVSNKKKQVVKFVEKRNLTLASIGTGNM